MHGPTQREEKSGFIRRRPRPPGVGLWGGGQSVKRQSRKVKMHSDAVQMPEALTLRVLLCFVNGRSTGLIHLCSNGITHTSETDPSKISVPCLSKHLGSHDS